MGPEQQKKFEEYCKNKSEMESIKQASISGFTGDIELIVIDAGEIVPTKDQVKSTLTGFVSSPCNLVLDAGLSQETLDQIPKISKLVDWEIHSVKPRKIGFGSCGQPFKIDKKSRGR